MIIITSKNLVQILRNTLNHMDPRLVNHGTRVAYMVWKTLTYEGKMDSKSMRDATMIAMLHDVGAYKTEEIDKMMQFETTQIFEHSAYGYLFLKYLSPLKDLPRVALCHHIPYDHLVQLQLPEWRLIQLITLCDRIDVLMNEYNDITIAMNEIQKSREQLIASEILDLLLCADQQDHFLARIYEQKEEVELDILYTSIFQRDEIYDYLRMIAFSIDFRSEFMVSHTLTTTSISTKLAGLLHLSEDEIEKIYIGSLLHDLGKVAIPVSILEYPGKLDEEKMRIMRTHVTYSAEILDGYIDQEVCNIAIRHHEKLNGNGYPHGLHAIDLDIKERITAIADIFSALVGTRSYKKSFGQAEISSILQQNADNGSLDPSLVKLAIEHYDDIMTSVNEQCTPLIETYHNIATEYDYIMHHFMDYVAQQTIAT